MTAIHKEREVPQSLIALLRKFGIDYANERSNTYRKIRKEGEWRLFRRSREK